MACGRLGTGVLEADVSVVVYTVPSAVRYAELTLNFLNPGGSIAVLDVAVSPGGLPVAEDYIEDGATIPPNGGVLERTGLICSPGEEISVTSSVSGVVVRVSGIERTTA